MSTDLLHSPKKDTEQSIKDAIDDLWPRSARVFPTRKVKRVLVKEYQPDHLTPFKTTKLDVDVGKINTHIAKANAKEDQ